VNIDFLYAEDPPIEDRAGIEDVQETWSVGLSKLKSIGVDNENLYLTMNLPGLILEKIRLCKEHYLSGEEKEGYKRNLLEELIDEREKELHSLLNELDKFYFSETKTESTFKNYNERIEELKNQIARLNNYPMENIKMKDKKPIAVATGENSDELLPEMRFSPAYMAYTYSLDMYLYGTIEEIEEYFFVNVYVWNSVLGEHQKQISDVATKTGIQELGERIASQIVRIVMGREWALLSIEVSPEAADIYIDGEYWGAGKVNRVIIEPGTHIVDVVSEQYTDRRIEYYVEKSKENELFIELEKADTEAVRINSLPFGADVYEGSTWVGKTPVSIPRTENLKRLLIKAPMFATEKLTLSPDSPGEIFLRLSPFAMDTKRYIEKKRDEFYRAAGFFVLTFPLPFFLYSMSEDFASGYVIASQSNDTEGMAKNLQRSAVAYHSYIGSLVVVTSMLINTVVNLAEYIIAGEG
jgi:hypothetical protein